MTVPTSDMAALEAEETALVFPHFSEATALTLGLALVDLARGRQLRVVIDIRTPDRTLFHVAMPGSTPLNDRWARRKSAVTLAYHASSLLVGERLRARGATVDADGLDPADHSAHGGSVPIRSAGLVAGCVTVSGLPQREDHALVTEALRLVIG